jgi:hypothetical protein
MSSLSQFKHKHKVLNVFEDVDNTIPPLRKMYGVNYLYADLVGMDRVVSSSTKTCKPGKVVSTIINLATEYFGLDPIPVNDQTNRLLWVGANKRHLYSIPRLGGIIYLSSVVPDDYRVFWDGDLVEQQDSDVGDYELTTAGFVVLNKINKSYNIVPLNYNINWLDNDISVIILYLIRSYDRIAFYVKPIGIDLVCIQNFNTNVYVLEEVIFKEAGTIDKLDIQPLVYSDNLFIIEKSKWAFTDVAGIKFRLCRGKSSGEMSPKTIRPIKKTHNIPYIKWVVV